MIKGRIALLILLVNEAAVAADYDIGGPDDGPLQKVTEVLQYFVNFVSGPAALAFCFISLAVGAAIWAIAPRLSGILGLCARIIVGVVAFLNLAGWMTYLTT